MNRSRRAAALGFEGRSALVLGGTRGLGRAVAVALAREGARVVAVGREPKPAAGLRALARAQGLPIRVLRGDARRPGRAEAWVRAAGGPGAGPDMLIHAVGDYWQGSLSRLTPQTWGRLVDSNVTTALRALRAVLPGMRRRRYGRILLFGVVGGDTPRAAPRAHAYRATKTALLTMARSIAAEEAEHGITVNVILPGIIRTERRGRAARVSTSRIPARRAGTASEVARAALFLLAPESGYITGNALAVAGGYLL